MPPKQSKQDKAYIVLAPEFRRSVYHEGFCWRTQLATAEFARACAKRDELRANGDSAHVVEFWTGIRLAGKRVDKSAFRALHSLPEVAVTDNPSDYVVENGVTIDKFALAAIGYDGWWFIREDAPDSLSEALEMAQALDADDQCTTYVVDNIYRPDGTISTAKWLDDTMADVQDPDLIEKAHFTYYTRDAAGKLEVKSREI